MKLFLTLLLLLFSLCVTSTEPIDMITMSIGRVDNSISANFTYLIRPDGNVEVTSDDMRPYVNIDTTNFSTRNPAPAFAPDSVEMVRHAVTVGPEKDFTVETYNNASGRPAFQLEIFPVLVANQERSAPRFDQARSTRWKDGRMEGYTR